MVHVDWTIQPDVMHIPIHIAMIKERLTRNLAPITPDVVDEVQRGFKEFIPATEKGTSHNWLELALCSQLRR